MTLDHGLNKFSRFRIYTCADCNTRRRVYMKETIRNKRLQCNACGSYYLIPSSMAKAEQLYKNQRQVIAPKETKANHERP